jgi:N-acetylglucosamine transport system permease protein
MVDLLNTARAESEKTALRPARRFPRMTPERIVFFVVFLLIPLAVYIIFVVSPFVQAFFYSLTDWRGLSQNFNFIGLENYERLAGDPVFWKALRNNLVMLVVLPVVTISLSYALALVVTIGGSTRGGVRGLAGGAFYRIVSLFPYVIPAVVIGILFNFIYNPNGGLLNGILSLLPGVDTNHAWLGDPDTALIALMVAVIWNFVGFYMVLFIAAIKAIPSEVLEAARLDGAGRLRTALQVVAPQIRDNVSTALVYMGILALDLFTYVSVMTPNGGTANSTLTVSLYLYQTAFIKTQFGQASAMGVVMALITMIMAVAVITVMRRKKGE